ncbi:MAG: EamA family transporter, partial [Firmicutes bacterium]|nr:EamA family transporter [Bacillota bacterium]
MLACILCAVCYGLFSVLNKKNDYDQNLSMMIFWTVTSLEGFAVCLLTRTWVPVSLVHVPGFLWLGIAVDAAGYLFWALALKEAENTAFVANLAYLTPFITVALSALLLKEELKLTALLALVIIVAGILIQSTEGR